jgi:hypothetical protein
MSAPGHRQEKHGRSFKHLLEDEPRRRRDDPRYWREQIDRWERAKERDYKKRRMNIKERAETPFQLHPERLPGKQQFWQEPQQFWQEPEPLKEVIIDEVVRPLTGKLAREFENYLRKLWVTKQKEKIQDNVRNARGFFDRIRRQWEDGAISLIDYARTLRAFYALLKLLDKRHKARQQAKEQARIDWYKEHGATFREARHLIVADLVDAVKTAAKGDGGLAEQFLQETGMGSIEEIEVVPGLKLKIKDTKGGDDGGDSGDSDTSTTDDSTSKKKQEKPKTPQEEKASRKWMALSAKLRAEASGLDKEEARQVLKDFGAAVAKQDEQAARKALQKSKNATDIWKWAREKFFKGKKS